MCNQRLRVRPAGAIRMQKKAKLRSALARGAFVAGVRRDMAGGMSLQPCAAAALMACAVAAMVAPQAAWAQPSVQAEFNIPAQPLDSALRVFSEQSKHQVLFEEEAVAGKRAPALSGRLAPREALDRLLVGSGVQVNSARPGVFTLKASPVQPAAGDAATLAEVKVIAQAERAGELPEAYAGGQVARGASLGGARSYRLSGCTLQHHQLYGAIDREPAGAIGFGHRGQRLRRAHAKRCRCGQRGLSHSRFRSLRD
jgi:hypothetical protein